MIGLESANEQINMIYTPQNNNLVQEPLEQVEKQITNNTNENNEEDEEVVQIQNEHEVEQEVEIQAQAQVPEKKESEKGGLERAS